MLMNHAMAIERADAIGAQPLAQPYQRTDRRRGHANGYKPKTLRTRLGDVPVKVPQVRGDVSFYPTALDKGPQTERALHLAVAEMYIQGVSTRRVEPILQQLVGHGISSTSVSNAAAQLDETLTAWRDRPLDGQPCPYLILDARYEKARYRRGRTRCGRTDRYRRAGRRTPQRSGRECLALGGGSPLT